MRRETCAERLQKALSIRNMKAIELCEKTGIPKSAMSQYINGKFEPKQDRLHLISKALDVSEPWLMGFDVPMYKTDFSSEENRNICQNITKLLEEIENPPNPDNIIGITLPFIQIQKNEYQFTHEALEQFATYFGVGVNVLTAKPVSPQKSQGVKIPVLGQVAAGIPMEAIENIVDYEEISENMASCGDYFGLKIKGSSMEPRIKEGDVVIVRQQPEIESGDVAIVLVNGDCATCKKVLLANDGITLLPYNPAFEPMFYSAEQVEKLPVRIVGKVVELRGKF